MRVQRVTLLSTMTSGTRLPIGRSTEHGKRPTDASRARPCQAPRASGCVARLRHHSGRSPSRGREEGESAGLALRWHAAGYARGAI